VPVAGRFFRYTGRRQEAVHRASEGIDRVKKRILLGIAGTGFAIAAMGFAGGRHAADFTGALPQFVTPAFAAEQSMPALDRAQIEAIVHDYIVSHPEVLLEAQAALEKKQAEQQKVAQAQIIRDSAPELYHAKWDGVLGNPDGKVTIVEFFDYNCHFCRGAMKDMQNIIAKEKDVRFVLKEFPVLGPDSQRASIVSMAFKKLMPEKYGEFHQKLLGGEGRADEASAIKIAVSLGANEKALRQAMKDPSIIQDFTKTYELADKLAINGTPTYVVADQVISGALGQKVLDEKLAQARACETGSC
jgi:protein-disulfide isomerase